MYGDAEMRLIQPYLERVGLLMAYYERFSEEALPVAAKYYRAAGRMLGEQMLDQLALTGRGTAEIAAVLNAILMPQALERTSNIATVNDDHTVICNNDGFCPVLEAIKLLDAPLDKVCRHLTWPWIEGIAESVSPGARMNVIKSRTRGEDCCYHVIEVS